jgi:hypothetical protein
MKRQIPIPATYFYEYVAEQKIYIEQCKNKPTMQQSRIDSVLASGKDHEIMKMGTTEHKIPLSQLYKFLEDAKAVDISKLEKDLADFKKKYQPIKGLLGDLRAAKIEAELKKLKNPDFYDGQHYNFYSNLCMRYWLNDNQSLKLMDYLNEIKIL